MRSAGRQHTGSLRRQVLGALLAAALATPALACGPDFPMTLLDQRATVMGLLPEGVFDFEAARLVPKPGDALAPVEWGYWDETAELRTQAETAGLPAGAAEAIAAMRAAGTVDQALGLAGSLPRDVALYTAGALAFGQGDHATALQYFREVSALPAAERPHRSLWASYMEGRVLALGGDLVGGVEAFERTRTLAREGAADPLGLAVASLGEQARMLREAGDLASAVRLYAEQAAYGSDSGRNSLLFVARAVVKAPAQVDALLPDATGTRLLLDGTPARHVAWARVAGGVGAGGLGGDLRVERLALRRRPAGAGVRGALGARVARPLRRRRGARAAGAGAGALHLDLRHRDLQERRPDPGRRPQGAPGPPADRD